MLHPATLDTQQILGTTVTATTNTTVNEIENETVTIESEIGDSTTMTDSQRTGTHETEMPAIYETREMSETHISVKGRGTTEILATGISATLEMFAMFAMSETAIHEIYVILATCEIQETCGIRGMYATYVIAEIRTHHGDRTTVDRSRASRTALTTVMIEGHHLLMYRRPSW
jgi:hypothetical protein